MSLFSRAASLFQLPATRRLVEAERAAETWASAPQPSMTLAKVNTPPIDYWRDQPPYAPQTHQFRAGYSDHTYQQFSAPLAFEGFGIDRIRNAVRMHRLGNFYESCALMVAVMGFAPVLAALQQAIAPILALPRHIHGGDIGLSRLLASEIKDQLLPGGGLLPSPYFPAGMWGTMAIYIRMLGFCVLQHVDGDPHPFTGIRPRYTRIWEPWALQWTRSPRKLVALTSEGPVEVCNDGKFTLVADEQEPYLSSAICALGEETLAGKLTQEARNSWLDFFGKPKLYATLPEKVAVNSPPGIAFFNAVETIYGPDGRGVLPFGSKLDAVSIPGEGSKQFQDALLDSIIHICFVLVGSAGTVGSGGPTGAGPYQAAKGGVWNVRHDLIARPTIMIARGLNEGHIKPYCDQNYSVAIEEAEALGEWTQPVLSIPFAAPDRDERIASEVTRQKAYTDQLTADRAAGGIVDQTRANKLAERFEALPLTLADPKPTGGEIYQYHIETKQVATDEVRDRLGFPPLPNGAGSVERLAEERNVALDAAKAEGAPKKNESAPSQSPTEKDGE